jgi:hypothetical protein
LDFGGIFKEISFPGESFYPPKKVAVRELTLFGRMMKRQNIARKRSEKGQNERRNRMAQDII